MKEKEIMNDQIEPERYEMQEEPLYRFEPNRRDFFRILGGGLVMLSFLDSAQAQRSVDEREFAAGERNPPEIEAWIHIGENGIITVYTGKVEVGQNIRTSLAQAVADELPCDFDAINMIMGDTHLTPYDRGTFGSQTTPRMSPILRKAAAAARETLIDLAAKKWDVDRDELSAKDGKIHLNNNGKSIAYSVLIQGEELMKPVPDSVEIKPPNQWPVSGKSLPKVDGKDFVTGKHRYSYDQNREGMLHGKVLRPPAFGARLKNVDLSKAKAMDGVVTVQDGNFIAVAADSPHKAEEAIDAIKADWETSPQISNKELFAHLKKTGGNGAGSLQEGYTDADHKLETEYTIAYIAHTPLEPRAGLAVWNNGTLTAWTGTQRPFGVQSELCRAFNLPEERVRVIMPDTGSGYGGKHTGEAAVEAARIAKEAGRPVKVTWTRKEEFTWAYFRPAGVIQTKAGMQKDGRLSAWEFHNYNSGGSALRAEYDIPHKREDFHRADSPLRQGSYRCLAATANNFARESFMDELANEVSMDPLEFRLKNLTNERFIGVLNVAAKRFGWGKVKPSKERGFGLAAGFEKGSYMACCVEIAIDPSSGDVDVVRVVEAFDPGPVINPDHLKNQIEGMIMMGIGGALYEAIEFDDGKILNPYLSQYRVPRFRDAPKIECVLIDHDDIYPAGGGETPIIGIAPAIANAIFSATGKRIRSMPLLPSKHL